MLVVGFLVPAFAGMTMHWGENRRFQHSKKVNATRGILGSAFAGMTMHIGVRTGGSRFRKKLMLLVGFWVPAFAGMTMSGVRIGGSRFRGNDKGWVGSGDSSLRWNRNAEPHDK